jgi:hypothetical protein
MAASVAREPLEIKHTVDEGKLHVTSIFQKTGDHAIIDHEADMDEQVLVALGYKQEMKRCLSKTLLSHPR